jgi:hypothetical protein
VLPSLAKKRVSPHTIRQREDAGLMEFLRTL